LSISVRLATSIAGKAVKTPPIDSVVTAPISAATTEIVPPKAKRTAMSL
jgi:hypothetical protein